MTTLAALPNHPTSNQFDLQALEHGVADSKLFARCIIAGFPLLGIIATLSLGLSLFASLLAGSFMLAIGVPCHKAVSTFAGKTLRLLITARLVIVPVLTSLLFLTMGAVWTALVCTVLLWLVADRLLGQRAFDDLYKLVRSRP